MSGVVRSVVVVVNGRCGMSSGQLDGRQNYSANGHWFDSHCALRRDKDSEGDRHRQADRDRHGSGKRERAKVATYLMMTFS